MGRRRTSALWLGLFAMLMLHVGPLYSALQTLRPLAEAVAPHAAEAHHSVFLHGHHGQAASTEPAWLAALKLCGYCELLTLNPPLILSLDLALPHYAPSFIQPLPKRPLPPPPRRSRGNPRAPPAFHR